MADPEKLGPEASKLHPKLRMIRNGDATVNALRSELSGSVRVVDSALLSGTPLLLGDEAEPLAEPRSKSHARTRKLKRVPDEVEVNLFVSMTDEASGLKNLAGQDARMGRLRTVTVPLDRVASLLSDPHVSYVEPGETLKSPTPIVSSNEVSRPLVSDRRIGSAAQHAYGENVLVGIIDVQGFDFAHPDFLDDDGGTRFIRIWDQGGGARPPPFHDGRGFDYGAEFTKEHLDRAIADAAGLGVPPQEIERQSYMDVGSHGTHVASIAAGNRGLCRRSPIAGVSIALAGEDLDRRRSFYDSTRIAHAVDYLVDLAERLRLPLSINVSLGTNGHAHDASSALSRWLDSTLAVPGRAISVAAGNAGKATPEYEGDIGFIMGRIHSSGTIASSGLDADLGWEVVGNRIVDLSENEMEIWYGSQDRISVSLRPPGSEEWIGPVRPGEYIENEQLGGGAFVSLYNELYHPANGANYIGVYLSPMFSDEGVVGVPAGTWTVRLHGDEIRDGRYSAWIERDDPRRLGRIGERLAWRFPSFFSEDSYVDRSTVSSLACGHRVLSVANLDAAGERINPTSSQGPTRDDREKPDVAAPGTDVVAARGFDPDERWMGMTGTSMASPYVCGVAGLMLGVAPTLTAAQILGIMRRTARPLPGADYNWLDDAGFGRIDGEACLREAALVQSSEEVEP